MIISFQVVSKADVPVAQQAQTLPPTCGKVGKIQIILVLICRFCKTCFELPKGFLYFKKNKSRSSKSWQGKIPGLYKLWFVKNQRNANSRTIPPRYHHHLNTSWSAVIWLAPNARKQKKRHAWERFNSPLLYGNKFTLQRLYRGCTDKTPGIRYISFS